MRKQERIKMMTELVKCSSCGAVSVNGGTLHCHSCFIEQRRESIQTRNEVLDDPVAPEGKIWLCYACGKRTKDRYGEEGGWDEACMLNSGLIDHPSPAASEPDAPHKFP